MKLTGDQARSYKKYAAYGSKEDFIADIKFNDNANKVVQNSEAKQTVKSIKDQIDYFGYEIEPFHMKHERQIGNFDDGGYFVFDKEKDKGVNDAWLDQLDQNNVFQELQEKAQKKSSNRQKKAISESNYQYELQQSGKRKQKQLKEQRKLNKEGSEDSESDEIEQPDKVIKPVEKKPLEELSVTQLKEILFELLEQGETPNQAMRKIRSKLQTKEKKGFKKNVRKEVKLDNNNEKIDEEQQNENKQMFDMLVDLCTILLEKTNDPNIYNIKKEDLIEEQLQAQLDEENEDNIF